MSGFIDVTPPDADLTPAAAQQPVEDLAQLLDNENKLEQEAKPEIQGAETIETIDDPAGKESTREQPVVEDPGQDEPKYTLKVNGEQREVTLDELKQGFQLKSDYTRKSQDLAAREQELGQHTQQIETQRNEYGELVNAMKQRLDTLIPPEPDWAALAQENPGEYARQKGAWDQLQGQVKRVDEERQRIQQEQMSTHQQRQQEYAAGQRQKLLEARPELGDAAKGTEFATDLANYGRDEFGFTPQEINVLASTDYRLVLMADKARLWDQSQKGIVDKRTTKPHVPVLQPGSRRKAESAANVNLKKARTRLKRSGSVADATDAILALG